MLDASALIAIIRQEPGREEVQSALLDGAAISTVNLSEVVAKLADEGLTEADTYAVFVPFSFVTVAFDTDLAYEAGLLRPRTRGADLSFGDRACLALARRLGVPVLTADRACQGLQLGVTVRVIR